MKKLNKKKFVYLLLFFIFFNAETSAQVIYKCIATKGSKIVFTDMECPDGYEKLSTSNQKKGELNSDLMKDSGKNSHLIDNVSQDNLNLFLSYKSNGTYDIVMKTVWNNSSDKSLTLLFRVFLFGSKPEENHVINKFLIIKPKSNIKYEDVISTVGGESGLKFKPLKSNIVFFIKDENAEKWINDIIIK